MAQTFNYTVLYLSVCCYCAITRRVRRPSGSISSQRKLNILVRRKVTRMSLLLVISYTLCYAPYYFWQIFRLDGILVSSIIVSICITITTLQQFIETTVQLFCLSLFLCLKIAINIPFRLRFKLPHTSIRPPRTMEDSRCSFYS